MLGMVCYLKNVKPSIDNGRNCYLFRRLAVLVSNIVTSRYGPHRDLGDPTA